jgi:16S rRNA processing protein RimM
LKTVEVGTVARAHGIRGEIRVRLHWPESTVLEQAGELWLTPKRGSAERFEILGTRPVSKAVLVRLAGIDTRDAADALRGRTVAVARESLPPLAPGEYYLCDLVGARVVGPSGDVGEVVEIRVHPSVDAIVVRTPGGEELEQPLTEPWIEDVDADGALVRLTTTEGMF